MGPIPIYLFSYYCAVRLYIFGIDKLTRNLVATISTFHIDEQFKIILKVIDTLFPLVTGDIIGTQPTHLLVLP